MEKEIKIFLTVCLISLLFLNWPGMSETSRFLITKAIIIENKFQIDSWYKETSDRSFFKGHYYSDKEPLFSFFGTFVYFPLIHFSHFNIQGKTLMQKISKNEVSIIPLTQPFSDSLYQILATFLFSSIPTALTSLLIFKLLRKRWGWRISTLISLIYFFASGAFHYSLVYQPYALSTFLIFLSFYLFSKNIKNPILHGVLLGLTSSLVPSFEIPSIILLFFYVWKTRKINHFILLSSFFLISQIPSFLYNWVNFGNLFAPPRFYLDKRVWNLPGYHGIVLDPKFVFFSFWRVLIDPYRGIFFYYPILLLAFYGAYVSRKKHSFLLLILLFFSCALLTSTWWAWWHGAQFSLKLMLLPQPFLFLFLPYAMKRNKLIFLIFVSFSVFTNLIGLVPNYEDILKDIDNSSRMLPEYQSIFYTFKPLPNVLRHYYLEEFLKCGPTSRLLSSLSKGFLDIRALLPVNCETRWFNIAILLTIIFSLWYDEIAEILGLIRKKKISIRKKYLIYFMLFFFTIPTINFFVYSFDAIKYPWDLDYSESFFLVNVIKIFRGKNIYELDLFHLVPTKYFPLFYLFMLPIVIFGEKIITIGRLLNFLFLLLSGLTIFLITRRVTRDKLLSLISLMIFLSFSVTFYSVQIRVDNLALLFMLFSVYLYLKNRKLASICFGVLSFLTKQTFVYPLVGIFIHKFFIKKKRKEAILQILFGVGIILVFLVGWMSKFGLQMFRTILLFSSSNLRFDEDLFRYSFKPYIPLIVSMIFYAVKRKNKLSSFFFVTLILSVIQFFRIGGWVYYLLPLHAIISIYWASICKEEGKKDRLFFLTIVLIFTFLAWNQKDPRMVFYSFERNKFPPIVNLASDNLIQFYADIAEKPYVEHESYLIRRNIIVPEIFSYYELENKGLLKCEDIKSIFSSSNYTSIIYYSRIDYFPCMKEYISKNYVLVKEVPWIDQAMHKRVWKVYVLKTGI